MLSKVMLLLCGAALASAQGDQPQAAMMSYGSDYNSRAQYCAVRGYPDDAFKVGCSYTVPGQWQCRNYQTMTLWCVKNRGRAQAYYCCGRDCNYYKKPKRCDKPQPPLPPPPPPPTYQCNLGQGKSEYNFGSKNGATTLQTAFNNAGKDCARLDSIYRTVQKNTPKGASICLSKGWQDGAKSKYESLQANCINDCAGSGISTGNAIGGTFCGVASSPMAASASGPTVAICNAVEQSLCESTYEDYVNNNCPEKIAVNRGLYNDLKQTCQITLLN